MVKRQLSLSMPHAGLRARNWLLAALPDADYRRLAGDLTLVKVKRHQLLQYCGEEIRHVYFPTDGVFSVTAVLPDGAMIEAATIGTEGMLGLEAFFRDAARAPGHTVVEVAEGSAARLDVRVFRRELQSAGALHRLMGRYAPFFLAQAMQLAACNTLHHIQQRLARWLLLVQDRLDRDPQIRVSHEFLGTLLGARRPSVSVAAAALQRAGLISYSHGHVAIRDRVGLEAAACPCYAVLREQLTGFREDLRRRQCAVLDDTDAAAMGGAHY